MSKRPSLLKQPFKFSIPKIILTLSEILSTLLLYRPVFYLFFGCHLLYYLSIKNKTINLLKRN